jgi:hypothetical protein
MHQANVVSTRLLMRRMIHGSRARQSLDAVIASDARSEGYRVACAAGLAVGKRAEFGAELLFEEY